MPKTRRKRASSVCGRATTRLLKRPSTAIWAAPVRRVELELRVAVHRHGEVRATDVQRLERRVIDGNTPAAIAQAAVAAGLVPSGAAAYLVLDPDGVPVLRGEPVPAEAPPTPPAPAPAERPAGGN